MVTVAGTGRMAPVAELGRRLRVGEVSSRELVEGCLTAVDDPAGEGARTFTRVYREGALAAADEADRRLRAGDAAGPLLGVPVSIKDLFDVAGEATAAGSEVLRDAAPATADAEVVRRLKAAGAVLMGRTNMTEFAYSGLGLNPHYGTPRGPWDRATGRIPGGSSSGAAVSVADGMAAVGIGSDTGGSVRIPAALCGLTGWKPTARRVSREGVLPLSTSLDSIGPIGVSVTCCAVVDAVLSGEAVPSLVAPALGGLRLGVLQGYVLEGLDDAVGAAFERALGTLSAAGARVEPVRWRELDRVPERNQIASREAWRWHEELLKREGARYDPHVRVRIENGSWMEDGEYDALVRLRGEMIERAGAAFAGFDAILLPTTMCVAPAVAELEACDTAYFEANGRMLRNPSIFNYLDGCGLSVPCHWEGEGPVGLMVAGMGGWDAGVIRVGLAVELGLGGKGA